MRKEIYFCDCCGKQCDNTWFTLPVRKYEEDRTYCVADSGVNLCEECQKKIAGLVESIQLINKDCLKMVGGK